MEEENQLLKDGFYPPNHGYHSTVSHTHKVHFIKKIQNSTMTIVSVIFPIEDEHEHVLEHVPVLHNEQVVAVGMNSKHSGHVLE